MEVVKQYGDFNKAEIFNLMQGNGVLLKNVDEGAIIDIDRLVIIRDDSKETPKDIMHVQTVDGNIYSTESPTVQATILSAIDFMETHKLKFSLYRQQSKAGRTFMNVKLI